MNIKYFICLTVELLSFFDCIHAQQPARAASRYSNQIKAPLPSPWKQQDIGPVAIHGQTNFDGRQFILQASGTYSDSTADQFQFAYFPMESEGELTVRLVPDSNLKFSRMGLMMRESLGARSPQVSLMLSPGRAGPETTQWQALELSRRSNGSPLVIKNAGDALTEPVVTDGRFTGYYWLRLIRRINSFYAFTSTDGKTWTSLGSTFVEMKKQFYSGIAVSSGLKQALTTVKFDRITIPGWSSEQ